MSVQAAGSNSSSTPIASAWGTEEFGAGVVETDSPRGWVVDGQQPRDGQSELARPPEGEGAVLASRPHHGVTHQHSIQ